MRTQSSRKGFTLLEIMIVVIIVGVLAALALPRLFGTIEYSRSTEAFAAMSAIRGAMERCYLEPQSYTNCDDANSFASLDIADPGDSPGNHFTYTIEDQGDATYCIEATRNSLNGGTETDKIGMLQTDAGVTKCGTGAFAKIGTAAGCCD